MSSYITHGFIGATCGLALARVLGPTGVECLDVQDICIPPDQLREFGLVIASAYLALISDIDEPNSFIGQRVRWTIRIVCGLLLSVAAWAAAGFFPDIPDDIRQSLALAIGMGVGAGLIGPWVGQMVLDGIRSAAGGHRRWTHSYVLAGIFLVPAGILWAMGLTIWALIPAALAWGIFTHTLGDLVTPAGVPLLYPLSKRNVHLLPKGLRPMGEPLVAVLFGVIFILLVITSGNWWEAWLS